MYISVPGRKSSIHRTLPPDRARALGQVVRAEREAAGLSQEDVAARGGVSVQLVRRLEAGTANPTVGTLSAVAGALGTSVSALLGTAAI